MSSVHRQRQSLTFRARFYTAFAITPQPPLQDWLTDLDATLERSKGFFSGQSVALDLSAVNLGPRAIADLVADLRKRDISVLGVEGIDPARWQADLPPLLRGARGQMPAEVRSKPTAAAAVPAPAIAVQPKQQPASLLIEDPVRSGQSVVFMEGDVTVLGSVGSGAEIIAGGSIHIYGALRGRALPVRRAMPARGSFASASRPNCLRSIPSTGRLTTSSTASAAGLFRPGWKMARSKFRR